MCGFYNRSLSKGIACECIRCGMPNFSTSLFDTTASLEVSNRFETLSSLSEPDSPVPDNIDAIRKDRVGDAHGGVFFAFMRVLLCTETPELDTKCELIWCNLNIIGCRTLYF